MFMFLLLCMYNVTALQICEHFNTMSRGGKLNKVAKHPAQPRGAGPMVNTFLLQ